MAADPLVSPGEWHLCQALIRSGATSPNIAAGLTTRLQVMFGENRTTLSLMQLSIAVDLVRLPPLHPVGDVRDVHPATTAEALRNQVPVAECAVP